MQQSSDSDFHNHIKVDSSENSKFVFVHPHTNYLSLKKIVKVERAVAAMDKQKRKGYGNKSYYNKKARQYSLETGTAGFLCTCNFREKECVRDAYKILEEFAIELYGSEGETHTDHQPQTQNEKHDTADVENDEEEEKDISDALIKHIAELKAVANKSPSAKRFQNIDTGVKNLIFIRTTLPDPLELALSIFKKLSQTKEQIARFVIRLVPVQVICKANLPDMKTYADKLFEKYFSQEPKTFSIVFNRHCNDKIQRGEVIEELAELISNKNPGNKADLSNPEIAVVVEIVRGFCLFSIAPDYFKYKKYNLLELCNIKDVDKSSQQTRLVPASDAERKLKEDNTENKQIVDSETPEVIEKEGSHEQSIPITSDGEKKLEEENTAEVDRVSGDDA